MFDWDDANLDHIAEHDVEPEEAGEAVVDPKRVSRAAPQSMARDVSRFLAPLTMVAGSSLSAPAEEVLFVLSRRATRPMLRSGCTVPEESEL